MPPIDDLLQIMSQLRDPQTGCEWDCAQSFETIAPYTIEEAYEVREAIQRNDMHALRDELGDLLLQIVFHAQIAKEAGQFDFDDVARGIGEKMLRRHPHVFANATAAKNQANHRDAWEDIKAAERDLSGATSAIDGVAIALPALMRAEKLQKRAARVGFDWPDVEGVLSKVIEEADELANAADASAKREEYGDLLFTMVNLGRHLDLQPEQVLEEANQKFERRFRRMEAIAKANSADFETLPLNEKEALWQQAKVQLA